MNEKRSRSIGAFIYPIRIVGYALASLSVYLFYSHHRETIPLAAWLLILSASLHPHVSFLIYKKLNEQRHIEFMILVIDMFWISGIITALNFSPVYALPYFVANSATNFATDGPKLLWKGLAAFAAGCVVFLLIFGFGFSIEYKLEAALPGFAYLLAATHHIGFISYAKGNSLRRAKTRIEKQHDELLEQKKNLEGLNETLHKKNEEISSQALELRQAHELIKDKNQSITDSINYAKRIQSAILPSEESLQDFFDDSFLIFKPRDIVSGDFYWLSQKGDCTIVASVDCTGHGIPGAFMSLIGHELLHEIVNVRDIRKPDLILNALRARITEVLKQESTGLNDGMEISLCSIRKKQEGGYFISYAGAGGSIVMVSEGRAERLRGDNIIIGGIYEMQKDSTFRLAEAETEAGESLMLYLYSDGFQDQFGGPDNSKFLSLRFREMLAENSDKPLNEQKAVFEKTLLEWQAASNQPQLDDILLMGIRLG